MMTVSECTRTDHEHLPPCGDVNVGKGRVICGGPRIAVLAHIDPDTGLPRVYHDDGSLCPEVNGPRPRPWVFGRDAADVRWSMRGREA